jgi:hypothetical protein
MRKYIFVSLVVLFAAMGCRSSILDDPSLSIQYSVPQDSFVKLTVENSYNTVVATLVDGKQAAGTYQAAFNASEMLEGVYFYTLECKGINSDYYFKSTKHMLLIK